MTQDRYQLINSLADSALDLPEFERSRFLGDACKDDPELLLAVQELLRAQAINSGFMEAPLVDQLARDMAANQDGNDLTGKQFQHYQILGWLGSGGLGEVWLAKDISLGREVALKLLSRVSASDPLQIRRFQREARTASSLNHPNIVTIYEIGTAEAYEYIAQELVRGETLRQLLKRGPLPIAQVIEIGKQVAAALAAAHSAKIVHRDIKPENIMLRPDGIVKVLDFGLARFIEGSTKAARTTNLSITRPGIVLGTAKYMSPEQARGLAVAARSDIFSLGAVLYEMATGVTPFNGRTTSDVMAAILALEPEPISKRISHVPPEFTILLHRCLQKDPSRRYENAEALKAGLERIPQRTTVTARTRIWWIAAATLLVIGGFFVLFRRHSSEPSFTSMHIRQIPVRGDLQDVALSQNGDYVAYFLREGTGESLWMRQISSSLESRILPPEPAHHSELKFSAGGKYLVWLQPSADGLSSLYRMSVLQPGAPAHIRDNLGSSIAFSPDGESYAYFRMEAARRRTTLMVATIDGKVDRPIDTRDSPRYFGRYGLAWSPDSRYIGCFVGEARGYNKEAFHLVKIRVSDGHEQRIGTKNWLWTGSMSWPTAGTVFASATEQIDDNFQVWQIPTAGGAVAPVTNDLSSHRRISASSDGKTILTLQVQNAFEVWLLNSSDLERPVQITSGDVRSFDSLAWLSDDRLVFSALGGESRNIWVMNSDGSEPRQLSSGPGNKREVAVTRDGKYILFKSDGAIWRMDSNGNNAIQLTHGRNDVHPEPGADGRSVLYGSFRDWSPGIGGMPTLWRVPIDGGQPAPVSDIAASVPKLSPDRLWIACEYFPGIDPQLSPDDVAILPASGGKPVRVFEQIPQARSFISWAPTGNALEWSASQGGFDNIWRMPIANGSPREVTHFRGSAIAGFAWSHDGSKLAVVRSNTTRDIVLIQAAGSRF